MRTVYLCRRYWLAVGMIVSVFSAVPIVEAQTLTVLAAPHRSKVWTKADIEKLPRSNLSVKEKDGTITMFEGVALHEILRASGVEFSDKLHGKALRRYVSAKAADKYVAVYAFAEVDTAFSVHNIVLAYRRDGKHLTEEEGAYRMVVPNDKRFGRWIRQVQSLSVEESR
jgi:hypothetical protein